GHGQQQAVGAEMQNLQTLGADWAGDDAHVGGTVQHAADDVAAELFLQVHRNAGPLGEKACQHLRQKLGNRGGVGEDADVPSLVGPVFGELAFQVFHLAHDQSCVLQQFVS